MISPDEYPVYNHPHRPGIGRDHTGRTYFNCFSISLERDETGSLLPYLFTDFLRQYNQYGEHSRTCDSCISAHKVLTFPADRMDIDRSAVAKKFWPEDLQEGDYHYCPLISQVLQASVLKAEQVLAASRELPAKPIHAILVANWDDDYLFEFRRIGSPERILACPICAQLLSERFTATQAERSFVEMWVQSMFESMEAVRASGQGTHLEETDFGQFGSRILGFVLPVPQVWVYVIPKPPPGYDWGKWEERHREDPLPQRVDFLLTYGGQRHIVELDDPGHYGVRSNRGDWIASEESYRRTLSDSRWLRRCGFEVHRFTNEEILDLYTGGPSGNPHISGFPSLLRSVCLDPEQMVLLRREQVAGSARPESTTLGR